jgi:TRAP transporter 4TM/12TM fusion protein
MNDLTSRSLEPNASPFPDQRDLSGWLEVIARVLAVSLPILTIVVAFTGWFDTVTRRAGHLWFVIPLTFLYYPARKGLKTRVQVLDLACAAGAFVAFGWVIFDRGRIVTRLVYVDPLSPIDLVLGILAILLVLEATRRTLGNTLVILALCFLAYALAGPLMPGVLEHKGAPLGLLIEHLYLVPEGLFNMVTGVMATYLLVFLTFGALLRYAGGERVFADLTVAVAGRWVGGPAKAAVIGSLLMGSVTGSTIANVVTTGTFTIPLMKRLGFKSHEAAAVETASGVGGALMPPIMGAGVFIMAEITGISLLTILKYSLFPALLFFGSLYAYVHTKAKSRGLRSIPTEGRAPSLGLTLVRCAYLLSPLGLLIYLLIRNYSPFYASSSCVVALLFVSSLRRETRLSPRSLLDALEASTRGALLLSSTAASAALMVGVITLTGLMLKVTSIMVALAGGSLLVAVAIVALVSSILGMGLPITSGYIIVSTLGAPALTELGMSVLGAHLMIFWFAQSATITPPICMTAFVAARIAEGPPMRTGFEALRVGKALYFVPLLFAFGGILSSRWEQVVLTAAAGLLFLLVFPAMTMGYYRGALVVTGRLVLLAAGLCALFSAFSLEIPISALWLAMSAAMLGGLFFYQSFRGNPACEHGR